MKKVDTQLKYVIIAVILTKPTVDWVAEGGGGDAGGRETNLR